MNVGSTQALAKPGGEVLVSLPSSDKTLGRLSLYPMNVGDSLFSSEERKRHALCGPLRSMKTMLVMEYCNPRFQVLAFTV